MGLFDPPRFNDLSPSLEHETRNQAVRQETEFTKLRPKTCDEIDEMIRLSESPEDLKMVLAPTSDLEQSNRRKRAQGKLHETAAQEASELRHSEDARGHSSSHGSSVKRSSPGDFLFVRRRNGGSAAVRGRTDNDITDEESGQQRIALAKASALRSRQDARALANRLATASAATDNNIDDDEAGRRRRELEAASRDRRDREELTLAAHRAERSRRIANSSRRVDANISDERAERYREELKEASALQRAEGAVNLARKNAAYWNRLRGVAPRARSPPSNASGPVSAEELHAAHTAARKAAAEVMWAREHMRKSLTSDQKLVRRRTFADLSRRTASSSPSSPSSPGNPSPVAAQSSPSRNILTPQLA